MHIARGPLCALQQAAGKVEGVHHFSLGEDLEKPGVIYLSEVYEDYGVKNAMESSEAFLAVLNAVGEYFLSPPQVEVYEGSRAT